MAHGTSAHGEGLSGRWADNGQEHSEGSWRRWTSGPGRCIEGMRAAGEAAPLQLLAASAIAGLALGLTITEAGHAADGRAVGPTALQLALLVAACAVAILVALWPGERTASPPASRPEQPAAGPSQLLAQMHHDLRTPLNAMIGFSEVMLRELHGPLGNARYQEYAAHISESGGRLLKASEDALAVASTMSALVGDRCAVRRERLDAAALLRDAWAAGPGVGKGVGLRLDDGCAAEIECDGQATSQALQHLLEEALARARPGGTVAARSYGAPGMRRIEIVAEPSERVHGSPPEGRCGADGAGAAGNGLRVILARSLLEMQGATLSLCNGPHAGRWSAHVAFAIPAGKRARQTRAPATAGCRRQAVQGCPGGFAGVSAARASAGSHAAPPA